MRNHLRPQPHRRGVSQNNHSRIAMSATRVAPVAVCRKKAAPARTSEPGRARNERDSSCIRCRLPEKRRFQPERPSPGGPATSATRVALVAGCRKKGAPQPERPSPGGPATSATRVALVAGCRKKGGPQPERPSPGGPATSATRCRLPEKKGGPSQNARARRARARNERDSSCTRCRRPKEERCPEFYRRICVAKEQKNRVRDRPGSG